MVGKYLEWGHRSGPMDGSGTAAMAATACETEPTGRLARYLIATAALVTWLLVCLSAASLHVKLLVALVALTVAGVWLMAAWAGDSPRRRALFCRALILAPTFLLLAEGALAFADWREGWQTAPLRVGGMFVGDQVCTYKLIPSMRHELWGGTVAIDRNGFRSSYDVPLAKDPARIRVMLLGGSSAFGWCVPDGGDIAAHMRSLLNSPQEDKRYEVINAAVPYYTSFQEVNRYLHVLADFNPDILVVLTGRNDLWFAVCEGGAWRPVRDGGVGYIPLLKRPVSASEHFEAAIMHSALYRRLYWRADRLLGNTPNRQDRATVPDRVCRQAIAQFARHQDIIAAWAERSGTLSVLALQPIIYCGKVLAEDEERLSRTFGDHGGPMRKWWPALQAAAGEAGVEGTVFVDLTEVFADFGPDAYADSCHYTSAGNRTIAARLARIVEQHSQ